MGQDGMLELSSTVVSPVGALREPVQESAGSTSGTSPTSGAMAPVQTTATLY